MLPWFTEVIVVYWNCFAHNKQYIMAKLLKHVHDRMNVDLLNEVNKGHKVPKMSKSVCSADKQDCKHIDGCLLNF